MCMVSVFLAFVYCTLYRSVRLYSLCVSCSIQDIETRVVRRASRVRDDRSGGDDDGRRAEADAEAFAERGRANVDRIRFSISIWIILDLIVIRFDSV
jgi:hypothetical protein